VSLVLCYHSVSDDWDHQLAVTPAAFERQLRSMVRRRYRPVSADEAVAGRGRVFHVTFDDAYRDIEPALDLLESLGASATIFAATAFADRDRPLAVPELMDEVSAYPERLATMDWAKLRELVARGFEVGSHTVSHPHLPLLGDDELDAELLGSKLRCEEELGVPCRYLAYPYGEHDERVRAAARRAGYAAAFVLHDRDPHEDRFAVSRVDMYRDDARVVEAVKTSALRRPAYAAARLLRAQWPTPATFGHGWMVATLPAAASRFQVADPPIASRLLAAGAEVVDRDADVEIGMPSTLTGEAPMAISVLSSPPHDADAIALRVARRLFNSGRIRIAARRARGALRRLGYPEVEAILWDVTQAFRRPGVRHARRALVELVPQRALVVGSRGSLGPTLLDGVLGEASRSGATGFEAVAPTLRTGGVLILMTDGMVLRTALGPAGDQISRQNEVLGELRREAPAPVVSERISWPLDSGKVGLATWSLERRLPGAPPRALSPKLLSECAGFLTALHQVRPAGAERRLLADDAATVAPYRPRAVGERLEALGEQLDAALAYLPRGFSHGDFFAGNLLVDEDRLSGVIDWDGGGAGALPLLDLLQLRLSQARSVPDEDWGASVVGFLLPWARGPIDPSTEQYAAAVGFEADPDTLKALVAAYWLDRLGYQIRTHRFRRSQERWLAQNVDHVLDALLNRAFLPRPSADAMRSGV
jgi:peptidoglycan/xylan/chitin deacetylase (PgdA/CDA1 family)/aminoglycoside phosphotransferase (APT) family kinase protein